MGNIFGIQLTDSSVRVERDTAQSAGHSFFARNDIVIPAGGQQLVPLGVTFVIPKDHYVQLLPTSSLTRNHQVTIGAGVVDSDYTGEVIAVLLNLNRKQVKIPQGTKIVQAVVIPCFQGQTVIFTPDQFPRYQLLSDRKRRGFGVTDTSALLPS